MRMERRGRGAGGRGGGSEERRKKRREGMVRSGSDPLVERRGREEATPLSVRGPSRWALSC
jgi:hypothetical protein